MNNFVKHLPHYISLIAIFVAGAISFYFFSYDRSFLIGTAFALSAAYVAWGLIHHTIHKDMSLTVLLEYVAIAILGLVLSLSLIFRT